MSKESVPVSTLAFFASVEPFVRSELDEAAARKLSHKIVLTFSNCKIHIEGIGAFGVSLASLPLICLASPQKAALTSYADTQSCALCRVCT